MGHGYCESGPRLAFDIRQLLEGDDGPLTLDLLIDILNDKGPPRLREEARTVLREGFELNEWANRQSAVELCVKHGTVHLLERLCLEVDAGAGAAEWLDELSSYHYKHKFSSRSVQLEVTGYQLAKTMMRYPAALDLLKLAHRLKQDHEALTGFPGSSKGYDSCPNGTIHYGALQSLLFGYESMGNVLTHARRVGQPSLADEIASEFTDLYIDLAMLAFFREIKAPCHSAPGVPLDAAPFALSAGPVELVKPLLKAYMDAGLIDIDAPVHESHQDVGGCRPLDIAIWSGSFGAAAALVELGCRLDLVAQPYGSDPVRSAREQGRMSTATAITQALMQRQIGRHAAPAALAPARARSRAV